MYAQGAKDTEIQLENGITRFPLSLSTRCISSSVSRSATAKYPRNGIFPRTRPVYNIDVVIRCTCNGALSAWIWSVRRATASAARAGGAASASNSLSSQRCSGVSTPRTRSENSPSFRAVLSRNSTCWRTSVEGIYI